MLHGWLWFEFVFLMQNKDGFLTTLCLLFLSPVALWRTCKDPKRFFTGDHKICTLLKSLLWVILRKLALSPRDAG